MQRYHSFHCTYNLQLYGLAIQFYGSYFLRGKNNKINMKLEIITYPSFFLPPNGKASP